MNHKELEAWFVERIGKTIYRNKTTCSCGVCQGVYERGLILADKFHASYVTDLTGQSNMEGYPLQYFDTEKERDEYELSLK